MELRVTSGRGLVSKTWCCTYPVGLTDPEEGEGVREDEDGAPILVVAARGRALEGATSHVQ
jgi:hypothetical protein